MKLISFLKKIVRLFFMNNELRLFNILKLKKELENRFINGNFRIKKNEIKFKIKYLLFTKNKSAIYCNDIFKLIQILEVLLKENRFNEYLSKGDLINFNSIYEVYANESPYFFKKFDEYNKKLEKIDCFMLIQGSYADNSFLSYSDIDLVIIGPISKEISFYKKQIDSELKKIDPLQHHGVFYINSNSFSHYWQMDLPLSTLKNSITFSSTKKNINISNFFVEKYSSYYWLYNFIETYPILPINLNTEIYFAKYFLSQLMLAPTLLLSAKGKYVYKRYSFSKAKKYYSSEAWICIEIVSNIRAEWNQENINSKYFSNSNTPIKNKELNIFSDVVKFSQENLNQLNFHYKLFIDESSNLITKLINEI